MGYGKVAPAPVRSTDCAAATTERSALAESATAMLRTVLITCSPREVVGRATTSPGHVTASYTACKGCVTIDPTCLRSRGLCLCGLRREKNSNGCSGTDHALSPHHPTGCFNEMPYDLEA